MHSVVYCVIYTQDKTPTYIAPETTIVCRPIYPKTPKTELFPPLPVAPFNHLTP